jgi:hypothetical protein
MDLTTRRLRHAGRLPLHHGRAVPAIHARFHDTSITLCVMAGLVTAIHVFTSPV